jgi:lipopolysaccharide export system permease protein
VDILDRFLIREFLAYFVFILAGLGTLYLGIDFLSHFWDQHMPFSRIAEIYAYRVPGALQQFVPVACLMAMLLVLTSMSKQNEILALYACGVGTIRILSTFIAMVATIATVSFLIFDSIVPTYKKKEILVTQGLDPSKEQLLSFFNKTTFWTRSGNVIYNVGRFVPESNRLEDVHIYVLSPQFNLMEKIHAKDARYSGNEWILENGFSIGFPKGSHFPITTRFAQRHAPINEKPSDFKTLKLEDQTMRLRELRKYIRRNSSYGLDTTDQQVHYHERVALIFAPLIFVLIGVSFAIRPLRNQSTAKSIGFCFIIIFLYLLVFRMALSMGKGGHIPPLIAAWSTNAIFFLTAIGLIMKS